MLTHDTVLNPSAGANGNGFELSLTLTDKSLVQRFEQQRTLIADRVRSIVYSYATCVYITGRTGSGKSFTVQEELSKHEVPWFCHNARISPMGLFELIREHPEHVVLLDDVPSIARDKSALQILLAAVDGDPQKPRRVSYKTLDKDIRFDFLGRLILLGNVPLGHDPLAQALAGRATLLDHEVDDAVMGAYCKHLALQGFKGLSAAECLEVALFVIDETRASDLRLHLRHLFKGLEDYRQWKDGHAVTPWRVLIRTNLHESAREHVAQLSKAEEIESQRDVVRRVCKQFPNDGKRQQREFSTQTGYGKSVFFERKRELKQLGRVTRKI